MAGNARDNTAFQGGQVIRDLCPPSWLHAHGVGYTQNFRGVARATDINGQLLAASQSFTAVVDGSCSLNLRLFRFCRFLYFQVFNGYTGRLCSLKIQAKIRIQDKGLCLLYLQTSIIPLASPFLFNIRSRRYSACVKHQILRDSFVAKNILGPHPKVVILSLLQVIDIDVVVPHQTMIFRRL